MPTMQRKLKKNMEASKLIKKYHDQWLRKNGHYNLGKMISKVKTETKWRDIFKSRKKKQYDK
jgi:hypothetical protein